MAKNCDNCTEKCPQAVLAKHVALGRMYATKAFTALLKKVESGELVEVVRCKDCKHWRTDESSSILSLGNCDIEEDDFTLFRWDCDFCSYGEKK